MSAKTKFIISLPKSTSSTALMFMAYSEVYLITLYLWGTCSFLDSALRQRTHVKKESVFKHDSAAA